MENLGMSDSDGVMGSCRGRSIRPPWSSPSKERWGFKSPPGNLVPVSIFFLSVRCFFSGLSSLSLCLRAFTGKDRGPDADTGLEALAAAAMA